MKLSRWGYRCASVNSFCRRAYKRIFKTEAPYFRLNGKKVITAPIRANALISDMIQSGRPFMVGRFGSVEHSVVSSYYRKLLFLQDYPEKDRFALCNNAGFFPNDSSLMDRFAQLMIDSCRDLDVLGLWNDNLELFTARRFCKSACGAKLFCLEPYYHIENSWTHALNGKKVLIVHPFKATIDLQLNKLKELFDRDFWPDCEIITYQAVQTIGGTGDARFADWFEALRHMKNEIALLDYDIAIIGCGAYGFPLASYIKRRGKQAVHLGGATQLLFGIKGKRWDNSSLSSFYNEHWIRPVPSDNNEHSETIEGGCYW